MKANDVMSKTGRKNRGLGIAFIFLFTVSLLFPVIASVANKSGKVLKIPGIFDVAIALTCFIVFMVLYIKHAKHIDGEVIARTKKNIEYIAITPLILIALYLIRVNLRWEILLIGLGWRSWLLIMATPYLVAALKRDD